MEGKIRYFCLFLAAGSFLLGMNSVVLAQEPKWHDEAELMYVDTSGNTEVTTLSA